MSLYEIGQLLIATAALCVSIYNSLKIKQVHNLTNSKMTTLIEEVREGALAKGRIEGVAAEKAEERRNPL